MSVSVFFSAWPKPSRWIPILVLGLSMGEISCSALLSRPSRLVVAEGTTGKTLLEARLEDGEPLFLSWRNSLFQLEVRERFFVERGKLVLTEVVFSTNSELPSNSVKEGDLEELYHTGGPFIARGLRKTFDRIEYRIGEIGRPRLTVKNRTLNLADAVGFGGQIRITIQPLCFEPPENGTNQRDDPADFSHSP